MRRWLRWGVLLAVLVALGWLASRGTEHEGSEVRPPSQATPVSAGWRMHALSQPAGPASSTGSQSIRGRVSTLHGQPVAGATVLASRTVPGESLSTLPCEDMTDKGPGASLLTCGKLQDLGELVAQRQGEVAVSARTTSAEDGSFVLEGLEAGAYALWVESREGVGVWQDVEAGRRDLELRLVAGGRLSGVVTGEGGDPIAGALVTAIFTAHSRFFEAVTDATGHYALGPLPRGEYVLLVSKEGWMTARQSLLAYTLQSERGMVLERPRRVPGRVTREGVPLKGVQVVADMYKIADRVMFTDAEGRFSLEGLPSWETGTLTLTARLGELGGQTQVKFRKAEGPRAPPITDYPEVTLELEPVAELRGHVLDESQRPIKGAQVFLYEKQGEASSDVASATTDAEGQYVLGPMKPGSLALEVEARGWRFPDNDSWRTYPLGVSTRELVLVRAVAVEGVLRNGRGQPVRNALVELRSPEVEDQLDDSSGPDGSFHIDVPKPGTYQLIVHGPSIREWTQEVSAPTSLNLVIESLPTLVGEVVDETGAPLPDVEVSLWPDGPSRGDAPLALIGTDARGHFSLPSESLGHYRLFAEFRQNDVVRTVSQAVEVVDGETSVRLCLMPGHVLSGVAVDRQGQPREGVLVSLESERHAATRDSLSLRGGTPGVRTGADGRFTFQEVPDEALALAVDDREYVLGARASDASSPLLPLAPGARDVRVVLIRKAAVHGRLVSKDGSPITRYRLNEEDGWNPFGEFSLPITGTGTLQFELSSPRLLPWVEPIRRSVRVQEEVDQDLGTIVLGGP